MDETAPCHRLLVRISGPLNIEGELNAIECIRDPLIHFDESQAEANEALLGALRRCVRSFDQRELDQDRLSHLQR